MIWKPFRGFSLIEMLTTLVVLATVTAIAVPSFMQSQKKATVEHAAITLFSMLELAQSESLKQQRTLYVHYIPVGEETDGCIVVTANSDHETSTCNEDNGLPKYDLPLAGDIVITSPLAVTATKLFYFSHVTGFPSGNKTLTLDVKKDPIGNSGVLVRRYVGLKGCTSTGIDGWEPCT
ncbi:prepilin-type N-terminal cleavage/methylation domain-containing protein [Enterovibrio nigricans]|uniref:Prepilin-type N-terminal cleavage/methylation domain-containing protein n=1 Tax=Enterovibrio nigricans DSM 22720 TaxID=1121868 RepID=A0A1T4V173_9GAMM|nr:prepilin-type N-terminal cleavage/methylation domain-containing protein [Enterovibrio nigricans]PKF50596.1 prepilin-type cleavage/methylation domain-containing protein [Enterovibrio nigricans]SKA58401.1 prepilin-type N-terminal cleavage/methylation domain-containing protein [Enterovibrio nigricans DSM 22720]